MTVLSDRDIRFLIDTGSIIIDPFDPLMIQPASIDLRLGSKMLKPTPDGEFEEIILPDHPDDGTYLFHRSTFLLAETLEHVSLDPTVVGFISGKSSRAREGMIVESAGLVDPGWRGRLTLEMVNLSPYPVELYVGKTIAQIHFERMLSVPHRPYGHIDLGSHYQNSQGVMASRLPARRSKLRAEDLEG